ncbi:hypothetical protein RDABS01_031754 [Bienertia sinuspersici]
MSNAKTMSLYIAISCLAFVTSKIIISIFLYKKWKRKHMSVQDSYSDIKSSNILLAENLEARVSDFGLATFMEPDKTHNILIQGKQRQKVMFYSFGVVLLELLTGKKPVNEAFLEGGTKLVTWVKAVVQEKREDQVLDSSFESCPINEVNSIFSIALMCLELEPSKRPTMAEVVKLLERAKLDRIVPDVSSNTIA